MFIFVHFVHSMNQGIYSTCEWLEMLFSSTIPDRFQVNPCILHNYVVSILSQICLMFLNVYGITNSTFNTKMEKQKF